MSGNLENFKTQYRTQYTNKITRNIENKCDVFILRNGEPVDINRGSRIKRISVASTYASVTLNSSEGYCLILRESISVQDSC